MVYSALKSRAGDIWHKMVGVMTLECHFCGNMYQVAYADKNSWTCPGCEQYNGFTDDGDYNRDLDLTSTSVAGVRFATNQSKSDLSAGNGLCEQCNLNQEVKMRSLNSFKCSSVTAKYKEEMTAEELEEARLYEENRDHLDRTYRLCPECDDKLHSFMSDQDRSLAGQLNEWRTEKIRNKSKVLMGQFKKSVMDTSYYSLILSVLVMGILSAPKITLSEIIAEELTLNFRDFWMNSSQSQVVRAQLQSMFPHICPDEAVGQLLSSLYIPVLALLLSLSILYSMMSFYRTRSRAAAINAVANTLAFGTIFLSSKFNFSHVVSLSCVSLITSLLMIHVSRLGVEKKKSKAKKDFRSLLTPSPLILKESDADVFDKDEVGTQDLLSSSDFTTSSPVTCYQTASVIPRNSFVPIRSPSFGAMRSAPGVRPPVSPAPSLRSGLLRSSDEISFTHEFATNTRPGGEARDCDLASLSLDDDLSPSPVPTTASVTSEPPFSLREYSPLDDQLFKPRRKIIQPARFQPQRPTTNSWVAGGYWQPTQSLNISLPLSRTSSQSSGFISGTASTLNRAFGTSAPSLASTHTVMTSPPQKTRRRNLENPISDSVSSLGLDLDNRLLRRRNIEDSISDSSSPNRENKKKENNKNASNSVLDYSFSVSVRNIIISVGTVGFVVSMGINVYLYSWHKPTIY